MGRIFDRIVPHHKKKWSSKGHFLTTTFLKKILVQRTSVMSHNECCLFFYRFSVLFFSSHGLVVYRDNLSLCITSFMWKQSQKSLNLLCSSDKKIHLSMWVIWLHQTSMVLFPAKLIWAIRYSKMSIRCSFNTNNSLALLNILLTGWCQDDCCYQLLHSSFFYC